MFRKSTWLHLRIPFSFFLLPVFLFALATSPNVDGLRIVFVFISLHLFLYPASNGYNSYFDQDEQSIGGLKHPPKVTPGLYYTSLLLDLIALCLGLIISWEFTSMLFIYGLISKAYSHPWIRIKRYPYLSWVIAGLFQGAFTFIMAYMGLNEYGFHVFAKWHVLFPALLTSAILWGSYPMTQIYQHEEDIKRGDITLSYKLGVLGTFYFTAVAFVVAVSGFVLYFLIYYEEKYAYHFVLAILPVVGYFVYWYLQVYQDANKADYFHTMRMNFISALCLNIFFIYFFLDNTNILQAVIFTQL